MINYCLIRFSFDFWTESDSAAAVRESDRGSERTTLKSAGMTTCDTVFFQNSDVVVFMSWSKVLAGKRGYCFFAVTLTVLKSDGGGLTED